MAENNRKLKIELQTESVFSGLKLWRQITWATGFPPYSGVPHLRGRNYWIGRLGELCENDGVLFNLSQANNLAQSSPSQMCSFWVKNKLILVLTDPKHIYDFKLRYHEYFDRVVPFMEIFPGHSRINSNGNPGLQLRALYKKTLFDTEPLTHISSLLNGMADNFIQQIKSKGDKEIWNSKQLFRDLVLGISTKLFMGVDEDDKEKRGRALVYLDKVLTSSFANPVNVLGFCDSPLDSLPEWKNQANEMKAEFKKLFLDPYKKCWEEDGAVGRNLFHSVSQIPNPGGPADADADADDDILGDFYLFTIGGLITTLSDTFPLVISNVCRTPSVKQRLEHELRTGNGNENGTQEYLDLVIKETLRIFPPVPIIPLRGATVPFRFNGIQIMTGDHVLVSPYLVHHSKRIWGENVEEFYPERFEEFSPQELTGLSKGAFIPFGMGPRDCVGRRYGMVVLKRILSQIFTQFNVELEDGENMKPNLVGVSLDQAINIRFCEI